MSEDPDHGNRSSSGLEGNESTITEVFTRLAGSTDVWFEKPVEGVETWNSGDIRDFSPGDEELSVHPEGARLENGRYQRCTRDHLRRPAVDGVARGEFLDPIYRSSGQVLAISDYRVRAPDDDTGCAPLSIPKQTDTFHVLHYSAQNTVLTSIFLNRPTEKRDVEGGVFLVSSAPWLKDAFHLPNSSQIGGHEIRSLESR